MPDHPNVHCEACHAPLADHRPIEAELHYPELDCALDASDLREQLYSWADYALGYTERAQARNYKIRTGNDA